MSSERKSDIGTQHLIHVRNFEVASGLRHRDVLHVEAAACVSRYEIAAARTPLNSAIDPLIVRGSAVSPAPLLPERTPPANEVAEAPALRAAGLKHVEPANEGTFPALPTSSAR